MALLEFPLVRARLAAATGFPPGRRLAEALEPSTEPVIVARGLDETTQTRSFVADHPGAGIGGSKDIGPSLERAARGGRLDPAQFLDIQATLEAASRLAEALSGDRRTILRDLGREIHPVPGLRSVLARSFDPTGELLDTASPRLGGLRRAVRVAYDRLRTRLDQLVHSGDLAGALQEPLVTLRGGRYVIPVRADARARVKGIVHDASGSGQTLFVEPLVAVELGNAWREAQVAEQTEVERILDELSTLVAGQVPQLRETLEALARFDFWAAKARLAEEMDAIAAEIALRPEIVMLGARHPGLSGHVVPIDIRLGDGYTALLITGPNTGGKTVALRTLGLLSLMHQAGLHVPAEVGTKLPILADVYADIGDEQSVAQSLSTFSGHMRSIVRIVESAAPNRLVLLDELGAGTDPTEGSALAQALLDHFIKAGALVAATTHYAELKLYAHTTPQARNASVEFDVETLRPTYRLSIGLPGQSQAFAIAERLGLPIGHRGGRALPAHGRAAGVRGDAGLDQGHAARDDRSAGAGTNRRGPGQGRPGVGRGRAPPCPARAGRVGQGGPPGSRAARRRRSGRGADHPPPARARDGDAAQSRRGPRAAPGRRSSASPPPSPNRCGRCLPARSPGAPECAPAASAAGGRAASPRWTRAAGGPRSRPAGYG